jgi:NAD(P)-dependent dehydrogenase (short-subunit alcohol dehydrogenase family)
VVVAVTSDAAVEGYEGWGAYGASKAAFEQVAHVLAAEEPALAIYRLDPGDMRTRMHQDAFPGEDISDRPEPSVVASAVRRLVELRPPSGRHRATDLLEEVAT